MPRHFCLNRIYVYPSCGTKRRFRTTRESGLLVACQPSFLKIRAFQTIWRLNDILWMANQHPLRYSAAVRSFIFALLFFLTLDAYSLVNGAPLKDSPDIVRIKFRNGWVCSGVYLDPYTILTAAHCISSDKQAESLQIDQIQSEDDYILDAKVTQLIPNPDYSAQYWPAYDVGVIKTTKNQKFSGHFQLQEGKEGYLREAILIGCGRIEYDAKIYFRTTGENTFLQIGAVLFFLGQKGKVKGSIGTNVSVAPNDSGGPIIDKVTGKIVGVMTTTTLKDSENYGFPVLSTGTSTAVEHNLKFIQRNMGPFSQ